MKTHRLVISILGMAFAFSGFSAPEKSLITEKVEAKAPYSVEVYSYLMCGSCKQAKSILSSREIDYDTHTILFSGSTEKEMLKRTYGEQGAPRIFINDHYIGSLSALRKLDEAGVLEAISKGEDTTLAVRKPAS